MPDLDVTFLPRRGASQSEEVFEVRLADGEVRTLRVQDYDDVYAVPGLYEEVVQRRLACRSPEVISRALVAAAEGRGVPAADLRVFDLGAGNGVVGEALRDLGVRHVVGLDPSLTAAGAARRDRPGTYADYLTCGVEDPRAGDAVAAHGLTCVIAAGAVGEGHIPPEAFGALWRRLPAPALFGLTLKADDAAQEAAVVERFLEASGLGREPAAEVLSTEVFVHRRTMTGEPLHYTAVVGAREPA